MNSRSLFFVALLGALAPVCVHATPMGREAIKDFHFDPSSSARAVVSGDTQKSEFFLSPALERELDYALVPKPTEADLKDFIHVNWDTILGPVNTDTLVNGFQWHPGDETWRFKGPAVSIHYEPRTAPTLWGAPYALIDATVFTPIKDILEKF